MISITCSGPALLVSMCFALKPGPVWNVLSDVPPNRYEQRLLEPGMRLERRKTIRLTSPKAALKKLLLCGVTGLAEGGMEGDRRGGLA